MHTQLRYATRVSSATLSQGMCAQVPEECPLAIAQLIDDCLENPPRDRPSARQAYDIIKAALVPAPSSPPSSQEVCPGSKS